MSLSAYDGGFSVLNLQKLQQVVAWPFYKSEERGLDKIHRTRHCVGFCGFLPINIFNFNDKFMFPVRQIKSCQVLAKNKSVMTPTIPYPRSNFNFKRLNPGGPSKGSIGRESILIFPDTPAVSESVRAGKLKSACLTLPALLSNKKLI